MIGHKVDLSPITSASSMTDTWTVEKKSYFCIGRNEKRR
jgi:hypothetical protein